MTTAPLQELNAPYQYVVTETVVSEVDRLLESGAQEEHVVSTWYRRMRRGPDRSILELEGLGAEIWAGVDAQQYVNELRNDWDHR